MMEPIDQQLNDFIDGAAEKKGKNFSRNRPRAERMEADYYQTSYCLTQAFIDTHVREKWKKIITFSDFCAGEGAIAKVLSDNGYDVEFGDIRGPHKLDFFTDVGYSEGFIGIMNPPFRLFNKWVEHCFDVFIRAFALLAPTTYLQGLSRYNSDRTGIFQRKGYPITHIYTFNRYPMLSSRLRPDGLIETGMQSLSWFVWTREGKIMDGYSGDTIHRWLDIDRFVLRKSGMKTLEHKQ
jgi:hypothetical protein